MRWVAIILVAIVGFAFGQLDSDKKVELKTSTISTGERLDYRMYLWGMTVAKGTTTVDKEYHLKNNSNCYKVDAFMQTLGMVKWISKVDDNWGAYVDTSELVTHESYRRLSEGTYRLHELIFYDHKKNEASVGNADKQTGKFDYNNFKKYPTPAKVRDIVGGFMYMRIIDFSKLKVKDTLTVGGFFEDKSYSLKIVYEGKETIRVSGVGKVPCHKLVPIMPDNQMFRGENSITVWLSDDGNQVPIKVDAKMFIGHAGTEITSFRGLKNQFRIVP